MFYQVHPVQTNPPNEALCQTLNLTDRRKGDEVKFMPRPYAAGDMDCYRVGSLVNNARNDSPDCLTPARAQNLISDGLPLSNRPSYSHASCVVVTPPLARWTN